MFKPFDPYQQINATPTPLLTIKRPDTFDLLMQENPGSDLSCFLLIAPIEETLIAGENPGSDLSCFYMHTPGAIPITGSDNAASVISCVSLYHAPEIDIAISDAPATIISCVALIHPIQINISSGEEIGDTLSCVSLFHPMNSTQYALTDGVVLNVNFLHGGAIPPSYIRAVLLCTTNDINSGMLAGQEAEASDIFDTTNLVIAASTGSDNSKIYAFYSGTPAFDISSFAATENADCPRSNKVRASLARQKPKHKSTLQ